MIRRATIKDTEFLLRVFNDNEISDYLGDDLTGTISHIDAENNLFLVCGEDGFFLLIPRNSINFELHVAFLGHCRGRKVNDYADEMFFWLIENTNCLKLTTDIPSYNYRAKAAAIKNGFVLQGINTKSFLKNGKLMDQAIYGKEL